MGRKSSEKRRRIRKGDLLRMKSGFLLRPGFYLVEDVAGDRIHYSIGKIEGSFDRSMAEEYQRLDPAQVTVDWEAEERRYSEYLEARSSESEEPDPEDVLYKTPFFTVSVRRINVTRPIDERPR